MKNWIIKTHHKKCILEREFWSNNEKDIVKRTILLRSTIQGRTKVVKPTASPLPRKRISSFSCYSALLYLIWISENQKIFGDEKKRKK